ncbi:unnamed protein product [Lepeophtheirus salmonis]|uniref:(salmon louse) hypothetical protein n=1 Tax=Lepeophtheirus salmonis TaxID=72036 RepID=A0A7R8CZ22_LEPSM|nr:unnamed protein product [Lepeophtheirus salmonis]CAF2973067.1 unnamed protein product [Lepeophtheirus salmonis]
MSNPSNKAINDVKEDNIQSPSKKNTISFPKDTHNVSQVSPNRHPKFCKTDPQMSFADYPLQNEFVFSNYLITEELVDRKPTQHVRRMRQLLRTASNLWGKGVKAVENWFVVYQGLVKRAPRTL